MNERIKELLKQSGGVYSHGYECGEPINRVVFSVDALEKFAELIVKECMAVAAKQRKPANLNYNPGERFVEDLRQHFGVKE